MSQGEESEQSELSKRRVLQIKQVASLLGTTVPRVLMMIKHGKLAGFIQGGRYCVTLGAIDDYQSERRASLVKDVKTLRDRFMARKHQLPPWAQPKNK